MRCPVCGGLVDEIILDDGSRVADDCEWCWQRGRDMEDEADE